MRGRDGRRAVWRVLALALATGVVFAGSFFATLMYHLVGGIAPGSDPARAGSDVPPRADVREGDPFNVLVLGVDLPQPGSSTVRSDTMILASVDAVTGTVSLISIPRDSLVRIPREAVDPGEHVPSGPTKINHAYAYGGADLAAATVAEVLGVPVHRYVRIDVQAFRRIVDLVGGVEVCIDKPMHYDDPYQDLHIHLEPGCRLLDGEQAMGFVRYRSDSDIHRIHRQQQFIRALVERVLSLGLITRLPALVQEVTKSVQTDLDGRELAWLATLAAQYATGFDPSRLEMAMLPGRDGRVPGVGSVWILDEDGVRELVDRLVWRIDPQRNALVRVAVVDAGGGPEAVERVAARLRQDGYQVVRTERAGQEEATSTLVSHREDRVVEALALRALRRVLPDVRSSRAVDPDAGADLTARVGRDARQDLQGAGSGR